MVSTWIELVSAASFCLCAPLVWMSWVSKIVPEPYLDEFFHVGQAQTYCDGRFYDWDPKITTPPGVYALSYVVKIATGRCDIITLRALNCVALFVIFLVLYLLVRDPSHSTPRLDGRDEMRTYNAVHKAINIILFPPLFFFSGLYYTDATSTLFVLSSYLFTTRAHSSSHNYLSNSIAAAFFGICSLFFRQTNVFWVAIFPAGLTLMRVLKIRKYPFVNIRTGSIEEVAWAGHSEDALHDKHVQDARIEDYWFFTLSLFLTVIHQVFDLFLLLSPYLVIIALFSTFIMYNGGVVLGDKSNHTVTIHLPQMLYIWPYTLFFSFPLALPIVFRTISSLIPQKSNILRHLALPAQDIKAPRVVVLAVAMLSALVIVHFNTIIHPFTLADNRHYVFYVFKILRRNIVNRYLITPVYVLCGWAAIQLLGAPQSSTPWHHKGPEGSNTSRVNETSKATENDEVEEGSRISFVMIWFITTALSLITAPLVEPRYFIIPWIIWRLHVPSVTPPSTTPPPNAYSSTWQERMQETKGPLQTLQRWLIEHHDYRLWLETAWFVAINVVTGYVFLYKGFTWPQEPGKVQRFMW